MTPLRTAMQDQARHCSTLGSPFMAQLCTVLAENLQPGTALTDRLFTWPGDVASGTDAVPLRLCAAFHALHLRGRGNLGAVYPPNRVDDDTLWAGIAAAMARESDFIDRWIDSPPQTNEVRRSAGLIAGAQWLTARYALPIHLSELGASGGLNLMFDRFRLHISGQTYGPENPALTLRPDWSGGLPPVSTVQVAERRGIDLNPLDPHDANDRLRLRAYLWADQPDRLALTDAAIRVATGPVDKGDAIDWLATRLTPRPGALHLIWHSIAWQYFAPAAQTRGTQLIEAAGARATANSPLVWLSMERDDSGPGAALHLRHWPGDHHVALGRIDFHGRWLRWDAPAD